MHFYHNHGTPVWLRSTRSISRDIILSRRSTSCSSLLFCYNLADSVIGSKVKTALTTKRLRNKLAVSLLLLVLIDTAPAYAFRCGNKIVVENMHEQQVLNVCGEPASIRHLGYTIHSMRTPRSRGLVFDGAAWRDADYNYYAREVAITEFVYNFGPRKFMRRLVFEGGYLVTIESIGYGYHERGK